MKISAFALIACLGLVGCVSDYGVSLNDECSSEGRNKPISFDNGAGKVWAAPNTARWCNPRGGMNPADDPIFSGGGDNHGDGGKD